MEDLTMLFTLDTTISIYVPSTVDVDKACDNEEVVKTTLGKMSDWFGGATAMECFGGWRDRVSGQVITEKVTRVFAATSSDVAKTMFSKVVEYAQKIKDTMKQQAIMLEYNGQYTFI